MIKIQLIVRLENKYPFSTDGGIYGVNYNDCLNISKVSTCILKPNVILQKKIDKNIKFKILKNKNSSRIYLI